MYIKVPFGLAQAPAYFQELITGILKDFNFAIAYLDDIIIFSRTVEEHLNPVPRTYPQHQGHQTPTIENSSNQKHVST